MWEDQGSGVNVGRMVHAVTAKRTAKLIVLPEVLKV
jgi:hypothetical protein